MSVTAPSRPPSLSLWQRLYGGAHRLRRHWYGRRARRLPRPVVSVGNLLWGGAGKTPVVAAVASHLRDAGWRVAVLSRGYGRRQRGIAVVSRGEGPLIGPLAAGDEPVLLAGDLPGVAVVVGADRRQAGLQALARLEPPPDLFVLDDGFSHLALQRDVDLLVFPAADSFGGGRLPPGGRLREPLASAAHADAAILTGLDADPTHAAELAAALQRHGFHGPCFAAPTRVGEARSLAGDPLPAGTRVFLASAIARPEAFRQAAEGRGLTVSGELRFPDHHRYPAASLAALAEGFRASGAAVVLTTSKDRVKLLGRSDLPLAELPIRAEMEEAFWGWLAGRLEALTTIGRLGR